MVLQGKNILITGASGGIGTAIAVACAKNGAEGIFLHCRKQDDRVANLMRVIQQYGTKVCIIAVDLLKENAVEEIYQCVTEVGFHPELGMKWTIDVLVNNAGIKAGNKDFLLSTAEDWDACMRVNTHTPYFLCQKFAPLLSRNEGSIINISSLSGQRPRKNSIAYGMSKAALDLMTRSLSLTLPSVRVNAIASGYVDTDFVSPETRKQNPPPSMLHPEELAQAVIWLLSWEARQITGEIITLETMVDLELFKQKHIPRIPDHESHGIYN